MGNNLFRSDSHSQFNYFFFNFILSHTPIEHTHIYLFRKPRVKAKQCSRMDCTDSRWFCGFRAHLGGIIFGKIARTKKNHTITSSSTSNWNWNWFWILFSLFLSFTCHFLNFHASNFILIKIYTHSLKQAHTTAFYSYWNFRTREDIYLETARLHMWTA